VLGEEIVLISSAEPTANEVYARLLENDLIRREGNGQLRFVLSGDTDVELGKRFLGPEFTDVDYRPWGSR
jgi:glutamate racemase